MAEPALRRYTYKEYLDIEQATGEKHEFFDGDVRRMPESSPEHALLTANVGALLRNALKGAPCRAYSSDLKIGVSEDGLFTYADAAVVCGPLQRTHRDNNAVMNVAVIVEVLSDSTEAYDRGEKFHQYQQISSFREYVLISHHHVLVDHFHRGEGGSWTLRSLGPADILSLATIAVVIPVAEIYDGVALSPGRLGLR